MTMVWCAAMQYFDAAPRHQMHLGEIPPYSIRKRQLLASQIRLRGNRAGSSVDQSMLFQNIVLTAETSHQITAGFPIIINPEPDILRRYCCISQKNSPCQPSSFDRNQCSEIDRQSHQEILHRLCYRIFRCGPWTL